MRRGFELAVLLQSGLFGCPRYTQHPRLFETPRAFLQILASVLDDRSKRMTILHFNDVYNVEPRSKDVVEPRVVEVIVVEAWVCLHLNEGGMPLLMGFQARSQRVALHDLSLE